MLVAGITGLTANPVLHPFDPPREPQKKIALSSKEARSNPFWRPRAETEGNEESADRKILFEKNDRCDGKCTLVQVWKRCGKDVSCGKTTVGTHFYGERPVRPHGRIGVFLRWKTVRSSRSLHPARAIVTRARKECKGCNPFGRINEKVGSCGWAKRGGTDLDGTIQGSVTSPQDLTVKNRRGLSLILSKIGAILQSQAASAAAVRRFGDGLGEGAGSMAISALDSLWQQARMRLAETLILERAAASFGLLDKRPVPYLN